MLEAPKATLSMEKAAVSSAAASMKLSRMEVLTIERLLFSSPERRRKAAMAQ